MEDWQQAVDSFKVTYHPWIKKGKVKTLVDLKNQIDQIRMDDPKMLRVQFQDDVNGSIIVADIVTDLATINEILDEHGDVTLDK